MPDLLFLAHRIPYPPNKGDKLRSFHVLQHLCQRYRVHLGCFVDDRSDRKYYNKLTALCYETCFVEQVPALARLRSVRGFASGEALSLPYYRSARMARWIAQLTASRRIDTAFAFSSQMAPYLMHASGMRRVIDFVDVDSEKWRQYAAARAWPMASVYRREANKLLEFERAVADRFDACTFVSQAEMALFASLAPEARERLGYFSNGVDADYFSPHVLHRSPYPAGTVPIVFTGAMDYWPNVEAVEWFAHEVFAPIAPQMPALRFYIVGARPAARLKALARRPGIVVTGTVPDTRPYLAHAACAVAPLRIARGIQNKVLEAMAMQKAIVVTPQALEGIGARPGSEVLVARDADQFKHQINAALDPTVARSVGSAARARILRDFIWPANLARLDRILDPASVLARECAP
ncbi:MAG: TIGR03087 family PEP-CTERM/XrtA system glycosyltransferase [Pseudomonadota bacterium]